MLNERDKSVVVFEPDFKTRKLKENQIARRSSRSQEEDDCDYFLNYTKLPYNILQDNTKHLNTLQHIIYYYTKQHDSIIQDKTENTLINKHTNRQTKIQRHLNTKTEQDIDITKYKHRNTIIQKYTSALTYRYINTSTHKHIKILKYIYNILTSNFLLN